MEETHFIKLRPGSSENDFQSLLSFLRTVKAEIVLAAPQGRWIIASLDQQSTDKIRSMRPVQIVSGVTINRRRVKVLRVQLPYPQ